MMVYVSGINERFNSDIDKTHNKNSIFIKVYIPSNTHYYNSNLIWRTESRRVDEVMPSDHPRRERQG